MSENQILDDIQQTYDFNEYLEPDESVIWADKPQTGFVIAFLEGNGVAIVITFPILVFVLALISSTIIIKGALVAITCALMVLLPQIAFMLRKRTTYALTNKRLFFKLWSLKGAKVHWLDLKELDRVYMEEGSGGNGTLFFKVNSKSDYFVNTSYSREHKVGKFMTSTIDSGKLQHFPSFESIPNVKEIQEVIQEQINLAKGPITKSKNLQQKPTAIPESELELKQEFLDLLPVSEEIEWAGKPNVPITLFENPGRTGLSTFLNLIGTLLTLASIFFYGITGINYFLVILLVLFILFISPDPYKLLKAKKTRYAIIGSKLYFKIWHLWRTKIESIDIKDIDKIGLDEKKSGNGTLYLQLKKNSDYFIDDNKKKFETVDLDQGNKQQFPTFEFVPDALQLRDAILEKKKELLKLERE